MTRIYVNSIINAVDMVVSSWDAAVNSNWTVQVNHEYNTDANFTPWVGIYSPNIAFDPTRSNMLTPFMATLRIPLYAQGADLRNPAQAIGDLEAMTGELYTAISCYRDLHNTVNIVKGVEWSPFNRVLDEEDVLVANELIIIAEVFA